MYTPCKPSQRCVAGYSLVFKVTIDMNITYIFTIYSLKYRISFGSGSHKMWVIIRQLYFYFPKWSVGCVITTWTDFLYGFRLQLRLRSDKEADIMPCRWGRKVVGIGLLGVAENWHWPTLQICRRVLTYFAAEQFLFLFYFLAQGKGIFLINRLSQLKKWSKDTRGTPWVTTNLENAHFISASMSIAGMLVVFWAKKSFLLFDCMKVEP